jgi:ubiquitin-like-conjugating enzyme ATG10
MERSGKPVKICPDSENARPAIWNHEEITEEPDVASISTPVLSRDPETALADLYVSWSPVYQVPVMYFRIRNAGQRASLHFVNRIAESNELAAGSALTLAEILTSSLFHAASSEVFVRDNSSTYATTQEDNDETDENEHFPAISQGEHPSTGTPCFFLHPCETSTALSDILAGEQSSSTPLRILECWFMIVGSVLDLR